MHNGASRSTASHSADISISSLAIAAARRFTSTFKTGRTTAEHYDVQFALYAYALRDEYRDVQTRLLRISDEGVAFEAAAPASLDPLRDGIARASVMADEPRPGDQCRYCPYAHHPRDAAPE